MQFRQMQQQQMARRQAGQVLYDQFPAAGPGEMGEPAGIPQPPPGTPAGGPQAPPPGAMSPGGGNPMAQGGASVMAPPRPQGGGMPPPPTMQVGAPPPMAQPGAMMTTGQPPIEPFKAMPSAPPAAAPGQVPPPPAAAAPREPNSLPLKNIIMGLRSSGIPADRVMDMLDVLTPVMNNQDKMELAHVKLQNQALTAGSLAAARVMQAGAAQQRADTGVRAEDRRDEQGGRRLDQRDEQNRIARERLERQVGGAGNISKWEYDPADPTKIVGGWTPSGRHIKLDDPGRAVPGKDPGSGGAQATVRANLVLGAANNALDRLKEIETKYPNENVSLLLQSHSEGLVGAGAESLYRRTQSDKQLAVDQSWRNLITEAIPVLTGGLRGSDSFRRFLIQESPLSGTSTGARTEGRRMLKANIEGMKAIFENKPAPAGFDPSFVTKMVDAYASDPKYWAPGTTKEQVDATVNATKSMLARGGSSAPQAGGAAGGANEAAEAQRAITAGANAAQVRARYKERTGKDLP